MVVATVVFSIMCWGWLTAGEESVSTTIRNLGLLAAAMIGLPIAIWRSNVAERQAKTAQRGLLNERYQKGAEMLGSELLAVRLGGIYALARLARERPGDYHLQIMSLLCAFVRHSKKDRNNKEDKATLTAAEEELSTYPPPAIKFKRFNRRLQTLLLREDLRVVMEAIEGRSKACIALEKKDNFTLDFGASNLRGLSLRRNSNLSGANFTDLSGADFMDADLSAAVLLCVDLSDAQLQGVDFSNSSLPVANLSRANLWEANLSNVQLQNANFSGANLIEAKLYSSLLLDADLSGANLERCEGLTQDQIDYAIADSDNPPKLEGVVDAKTGDLLVWRGKAAKQASNPSPEAFRAVSGLLRPFSGPFFSPLLRSFPIPQSSSGLADPVSSVFTVKGSSSDSDSGSFLTRSFHSRRRSYYLFFNYLYGV